MYLQEAEEAAEAAQARAASLEKVKQRLQGEMEDFTIDLEKVHMHKNKISMFTGHRSTRGYYTAEVMHMRLVANKQIQQRAVKRQNSNKQAKCFQQHWKQEQCWNVWLFKAIT